MKKFQTIEIINQNELEKVIEFIHQNNFSHETTIEKI